MSGDTIAAIATAPGRGGVAIVRVSGDGAFAIAERLTGRKVKTAGWRLGKIRQPNSSTLSPPSTSSTLIDEAVVLAFKAPHSYTGEDVVEFQCHGGSVTPRRVLEACFAAGARLAERGEFTRRAFLNGRLDYDQAASVLDLIDAKTARAADAALGALAGGQRREGRALYERALDLSTRLEYALDVSEEELPASFVADVTAACDGLGAALDAAIAKAHEGKILREGALVVLAGPPNAGKSSLMNALLRENRAIVSDVPGTTRDSIEEWLDVDGWPVRLVDTAGLRATGEAIEAEGVRRTERLLAAADLVLWLGDAGARPAGVAGDRLVPVHAKCDLGAGEGVSVSAKTGEGLDELRRTVAARLAAAAQAPAEAEGAGLTSVLHEARLSLRAARPSDDLVLAANAVRRTAETLGAGLGATYSSDLLDNLFSRFCVGK